MFLGCERDNSRIWSLSEVQHIVTKFVQVGVNITVYCKVRVQIVSDVELLLLDLLGCSLYGLLKCYHRLLVVCIMFFINLTIQLPLVVVV